MWYTCHSSLLFSFKFRVGTDSVIHISTEIYTILESTFQYLDNAKGNKHQRKTKIQERECSGSRENKITFFEFSSRIARPVMAPVPSGSKLRARSNANLKQSNTQSIIVEPQACFGIPVFRWLGDWVGGSVGWLVGQLVGGCWLVRRWVGQLVGGCLVGQLVGGWLVDQLKESSGSIAGYLFLFIFLCPMFPLE